MSSLRRFLPSFLSSSNISSTEQDNQNPTMMEGLEPPLASTEQRVLHVLQNSKDLEDEEEENNEDPEQRRPSSLEQRNNALQEQNRELERRLADVEERNKVLQKQLEEEKKKRNRGLEEEQRLGGDRKRKLVVEVQEDKQVKKQKLQHAEGGGEVLDSRGVFVQKIPQRSSQAEVREFFQKFGRVQDVSLKGMSRLHGRPGYGFVLFEDESTAQAVLRQKSLLFCGQRLTLEPLRTSRQHRR